MDSYEQFTGYLGAKEKLFDFLQEQMGVEDPSEILHSILEIINKEKDKQNEI